MEPMTQRFDSCRRVLDGSASEVPFPQLEHVRLNRECDSEEVWLTLEVRRVHTKDQLVKQIVKKQRFVQGLFRACFCYRLFELRNGAHFYTLSVTPSYALHHEVPVYSQISFIQ